MTGSPRRPRTGATRAARRATTATAGDGGAHAALRRASGAVRLLLAARRWYGEGPLHLLLTAASLALAGYAGVRLLGGGQVLPVVLWFAGSALVHDLVLVPVYAGCDRAVRRVLRPSRSARVNYVRVPVLLSGLLLVVWFPLVTGLSAERYEAVAALPAGGFLSRWLLVTGALCGGSACLLVVRQAAEAGRRRRAAKRRSPQDH